MDSIWLWALAPTWIAIAFMFVFYVFPRLFMFSEDDDE